MGRVVWGAGVAAVVAMLGVVSLAPAAPKPRSGEAVPGELIVAFKPGVSEKEQDKALRKAGVKVKKSWLELKAKHALADDTTQALKLLADDPAVRYAEPNYVVAADALAPNDPSFGQLWGLENTGQNVNGTTGGADADIDLLSAWDVTRGSSAVTVAVIDTGVDFGHPDLGTALRWTNAGEVAGNGVDDDANGYVDDISGWDFVAHDNDATDDNDHGTHVSGTIAARAGNGVGVAGVAPGVKIMPLKFLDATGYGSDADAVSAVLYAVDEGAQILSNSWGGGDYNQALRDAIAYTDSRGALFTAAAGNEAVNTDVTPHYPSSYESANIVSVAATGSKDERASFSNFGALSVDLGAPGANILSTITGGRYDYFSGTSMATPHVSGVAALVKSAFPTATPVGIKALLMGTVDPISTDVGAFSRTRGRLNAGTALACVNNPQVQIESPNGGFSVAVNEALAITAIATNCASPGASLTVTAAGQIVAMTPRGDGLYTGSVTPTAAGPVTVAATATIGALAKTASVAGSAAVNYRAEDVPYAWIDATAGGTNTGIAGDDVQKLVSLPFAFTLYGAAYTQVKVGSNGILGFREDVGSAYNNLNLPHPQLPNGFLAPFWDDLNPSAGGTIWTKTVGTSPNRKFVVEWHDVVHYPQTGTATFEAILEEGTNDVVYQWKDVNFGDASKDYGAVASVGAENADASVGKEFSYNTPSLQSYEGTKGLRLTMRPAGPPPPDTTAPAAPAGLVATAGAQQVSLSWAASGEPDIASYRVYRGGVRIAQVSSPSYVDSGLTAGTTYSYAVSAVDLAGNESGQSAPALATPTRAPIDAVFSPSAYTITTGTWYSGSVASLAADDAQYLQISGKPTVEWYGSATVDATARATMQKLAVAWNGNTSGNSTLTLSVYDWTTGSWVAIYGPTSVGTSDRTVTWTTTELARFVSSTGEVRLDVKATRSKSFRTRVDLVRFTVTY